jgi:Uma2 family endonuclease
MTVDAETRRYTVADYFRIENDSSEKHEYDDGVIVAMAGASPQHVAIVGNIHGELRDRLRGGPCKPYVGDLRVGLAGRPKYVYPDVSVICGALEYDPQDPKRFTVINPRVIVEVLSASTEAYDRGEKFRRYLKLRSFEEYVLVSQSAPIVEVYSRQSDGSWSFRVYEGMEATARLNSVEQDLPLAGVYEGVELLPPPPDTADSDETRLPPPSTSP